MIQARDETHDFQGARTASAGDAMHLRSAHLSHLLKERLLLLMPTRGVYNDEVMAGLLELIHTLAGNHCSVRLCVGPIEGYLHLCSILLELVKGTCTALKPLYTS